MRNITYKPSGVCSQEITFDIDEEGKLHNVKFVGGCAGNLLAIGKLIEGQDAKSIADKLRGNDCRGKGTSCADQLAKAIDYAFNCKGKFVYRCLDCNHSDFIDINCTLKEIHQFVDQVACKECDSKNIEILLNDELIYSKKSRKDCRICGYPIIEPRKRIKPNTTLCGICEQEAEDISIDSNTPAPGEEKRFCPRCGAELVIKERKSDHKGFWACSAYPKCHYIEKSEIEIKKIKDEKKSRLDSLTNEDNSLFLKLKELRLQFAKKEKIPPYCVLYDATLLDICKFRPKSKAELTGIPGVKETKYNKYGQAIIQLITDFEKDNLS